MNGLCEAEITAARSKPKRRTRIDAAGGGSTPPSSPWPPSAAIPAHRAASSISPETRVSRTTRTCGLRVPQTVTAARPSAKASSAVRNSPATPRTPSVPKSFKARRGSALRELRTLSCFFEPRLAALLDAGVTSQQLPPLELAPQGGVGLDQGLRDSVPDRVRLA